MPIPKPLFLTGQNLAFVDDADTVSAPLTAHARRMGQGVYAKVRAMGNPDVAAAMPIPLLLRTLSTRLDPERSDGVQLQVGFRCADSGGAYGLEIRNAVAEVLACAPPDATIDIQTTEPTLRGLLAGRISWTRAVEDGAAALNVGSDEDAARFWSLFDAPVAELPALALR
jgi:alkyl sulfatase BDS1-like metallo-beta-lactamase superfamily hydrolase